MISESDAKRRLELVICTELKELVPGSVFLPEKGGTAEGDSVDVVPPYAVVSAREVVRELPQGDTFSAEPTVTVVNHIDDASSPAHSLLVQRIYLALGTITQGYSVEHGVMIHGMEITRAESVEDAEQQSYGDVISLSVGFSVRNV